ncbi:MAG: choice-of-anchor D domain-containing protein, partial [Candidatus Marinimicrobia bacterium]|nr:choice-of-anchor D domain-containing protein [Candidatus Neomarinimicrobiota bacterium]
EPGYTLDPQAVDFGTVLGGQSAQRTLKIYSVGTADLTLDSLDISENTVTAGSVSFPLTLVPGDSTEVNLTWAPGATGILSATLTFYAGTSGITAIPVNLTGEAQQPVSFSNDIQPIFNSACVSCHGGNGGLFLTAGNAYGNLVNVTSSGYAPAVRVKPGDTANSVLYGKIFNTGQFGQKMPPDSDLSTAQKTNIRQWIEQGALNN